MTVGDRGTEFWRAEDFRFVAEAKQVGDCDGLPFDEQLDLHPAVLVGRSGVGGRTPRSATSSPSASTPLRSPEYVLAYATELGVSFTGMQLINEFLDGHQGAFAIDERGYFGDDGAIHATFEVAPGSATGELSGLCGKGRHTAKSVGARRALHLRV